MRRLLHAFGPTLLLAGCTSPTTAPAPAAATPDAATPDATKPSTPATSASAATPAEPAPVEPPSPGAASGAEPDEPDTADAPPPLATPATPADARFHLAAYRDGELRLYELGDDLFLGGAGGLARFDERTDRFVHAEYGLSGQTDPGEYDEWKLHSLGGRWPDNAWLTTESRVSRWSSPPQLHRREGKQWKPVDTKEGVVVAAYPAILNWQADQVLGLRVHEVDPEVYDIGEEMPPARQRRIDAELARTRPGFDLLGPKITPATMVIAPGLLPMSPAVAPTGELFLLATAGPVEKQQPRVQRWGLAGDAAVAGTVDTLQKGLHCGTLTVHARDEAYVGCHTYRGKGRVLLLRFDGAKWVEEPAPATKALVQLEAVGDGELYAIVDDPDDDGEHRSLWHRRGRDVAWERVPSPALRFADRGHEEWAFNPNGHEFAVLPGSPAEAEREWTAAPVQIVARPGGELWLVASTEMMREDLNSTMAQRHVVLRGRAVREPLRLLPDGDLTLELLDWRPAPAWKPGGCGDEGEDRMAFVPLRTLPRDAPRNQPEPLVEAFIRDNEALMAQVVHVVEVFRRGRRTVGLYVRPTDQAGADALLAALERVAPGEKRTIECRRPRIRREFDRRSGQALQAPIL